MKKFKTLFITTLLATATSSLVYANTPEQQFQQGVEAAEQGIPEAQYNLGLMYYNGQGVKQDYQQAEKLFQQAAEQGIAQAQYNLGVMYNNGRGVKQDYQQAVKWYQQAAEQGIAEAQYNLGLMYYNGQGVKQDYQQAEKL
ncbi:tetratricopeptide repeat protein, partial [Ursidibacter arcticus]